MKPLLPSEVNIPHFRVEKESSAPEMADITLFDLSSHRRAREAMAFGLKMREQKFHIFVVGEDRSGRMEGTLAFLNNYIKSFPPPSDWVYLNNFLHPNLPKPFQLPTGMGSQLRENLSDLIDSIHVLLSKTFSHPDFLGQIESMSAGLEQQVQTEIEGLRQFALSKGFQLDQSPQGFIIHPKSESEAKPVKVKDLNEIRERLNRITSSAHLAGRKLLQDIRRTKANAADTTITPLIQKFSEKYSQYLGDWIGEFKQDVITNLENFLSEDPDGDGKIKPMLAERYLVNVLIDNRNVARPKVVLEPNPTYENLFGSIKYRATPGGGLETNFSMIQPGAIHQANGGILVLRADAVTKDPMVWDMLKAALRDQHIHIEEAMRDHTLPLAGAPNPKPIPLDLQVFLVGAPFWYYTFFFMDPDFRNYFKVKADIDPDMPATPENRRLFAQLVRQAARNYAQMEIDEAGISYLMGYSARWIGDRKRITARFELIIDVIGEASVLADSRGEKRISGRDVRKALAERRQRNARIEDRTYEDIAEGRVFIQTRGEVVGQINALAVYGSPDHYFGIPSRITARTYMGESGVINIERLTEMGGPIQQKGAMILDGFINGLFAQDFPVSFNCSLTFEQSYSEVEGDSASMAELLAVFSALSGLPLRQDIGITGSMDQFGASQAIGGVIHKIEGFHRACKIQGLTGKQGVIIPYSNRKNVVLREDIVKDIKQKKFFIWPVKHVFEALELMVGQPAGFVAGKHFAKGSIADCLYKKLLYYHHLLSQRGGRLEKKDHSGRTSAPVGKAARPWTPVPEDESI